MANQTTSETKIITGKIRMSYANIFEKVSIIEGQEAKYSLCVLIPKTDTETIKKIDSAVKAAKKLGESIWEEKNPENLKTPLRDGDEERGELEEFVGHYFLNASSKIKPGIVDRSLREIVDPDEVYSGCYGRVSLIFYPYNQEGNRGIGCGLQNIQKLQEGEPLLGRPKAWDDFEAIDDDEDFLG